MYKGRLELLISVNGYLYGWRKKSRGFDIWSVRIWSTKLSDAEAEIFREKMSLSHYIGCWWPGVAINHVISNQRIEYKA